MKHFLALFCLLYAVAVTPAPAHTEPRRTVPVEGDRFEAILSSVDERWLLTFTAEDRQLQMPAADLVRWGHCAEITRGPVVVLSDGGLLVADVLAADRHTIVADANLLGLLRLPKESVAGVVFQVPAEQNARDRLFDRVLSSSDDRDTVILANNDEVSARFESIEADAMRLESDVLPAEIDLYRTRALVFDASLRSPVRHEGFRAVVGLSDGSRIIADRLVLDEDSATITIGQQLSRSAPADGLACLIPLGGRVTYLSDLESAGYRHLAFLELPWEFRTDRNATGGLLRAGGRLYLKGLGMHSAARLTYRLDGSAKSFQAEAAIDQCTSGRGSVRFHVLVDGRREYLSPVVRGGQEPVPISVDVSGAERLDLIVDYADRADELDHANWLGARLVK